MKLSNDPFFIEHTSHYTAARWTWSSVRRHCRRCASASARPYFHNGSAKDLDEVVRFYNERFGIGFTDQEKEDLIAFLKAL